MLLEWLEDSMTEFTRLRMLLGKIEFYLDELYKKDFSNLNEEALTKIDGYLDTYESVVAEMKLDVENELSQYVKKGMEIDNENKEIIIY